MFLPVLDAYGLTKDAPIVVPFGSGLINNTWKVTVGKNAYILQRVNDAVFKEPPGIAHNIRMIGAWLRERHPGYNFVSPLVATDGSEMIYRPGEGYFRMFLFVPGSHAVDIVESPSQAYEAALQFGRFTRLLCGLPVDRLKTTIPGFHDLGLRYRNFVAALEGGNPERINRAEQLSRELLQHSWIVDRYIKITGDPECRLRVTHHDTKISNVLFDEAGKGICVIDLDTVMAGYFISDVGDMMRTYLCPVSEEEKDYDKIEIREAFYHAIVDGYYSEMQGELTATEYNCFFYSGAYMIYMQALRFLTDYLEDDCYYGEKYPGHNLVRAGNQAVLLQRLLERENVLLRGERS